MSRDLKYGKITMSKEHTIDDDEPVFIFRARDSFAEKHIRAYAEDCKQNDCGMKVYGNILKAADRFRYYHTKRRPS